MSSQLNPWTSLNVIEARCRDWFLRNTGREPVFNHMWNRNKFRARTDGPVDVVLLGDVVGQLISCASWPDQSYRIWTLGSAAKNICVNLLGLPEKSVGVIPRYALFQKSPSLTAFARRGEEWSLVYSGRFIAPKNLTLSLYTVFYLQRAFGENVRLEVCGDLDNFASRETSVALLGEFHRKMWSLCDELPWIREPRFLGSFETDEWHRQDFKNPALLNLSTYFMEDFGVSVAQAQCAGWPCILSDWGGHRDVEGSNVMKIPTSLIAHYGDHENMAEGSGYAVAAYISDKLGKMRGRAPAEKSAARVEHKELTPVPLAKSRLVRVKDVLSREVSPRIFRHLKNGYDFFGQTGEGQIFFNRHRSAFGDESQETAVNAVVFTRGGGTGWLSHEEIIPSLETCWAATSDSKRGKTHVVRTDLTPVSKWMPLAKRAKVFVFTEVNPGLIRFLRRQFAFDTPMIIHTHGEGTAGMVGYREIEPFLKRRDVFIAASRRGAETIKLNYPSAAVEVVPFPVRATSKLTTPLAEQPGGKPKKSSTFVFAGRISEQKNLHTLLVACRLLKVKNPRREFRLHVYGSPDGFGSPNMGIRFREYQTFLSRLTSQLGLDDTVVWHGFVPRRKLTDFMKSHDHIFVSPSLHSDEEFGMAPFTSLASRGRAILSDWGGFRDLQKFFPSKVELVPVRGGSAGPFVSAADLAEKMSETVETPKNYAPDGRLFENFGLHVTSEKLRRLMRRLPAGKQNLRCSRLSEEIRAQAERIANDRKVFMGYEDPLALKLFRAYGMKNSKINCQFKMVLPWVSVTGDKISCNDPHRGHCEISRTGRPNATVKDVRGASIDVSKKELRWLAARGLLV